MYTIGGKYTISGTPGWSCTPTVMSATADVTPADVTQLLSSTGNSTGRHLLKASFDGHAVVLKGHTLIAGRQQLEREIEALVAQAVSRTTQKGIQQAAAMENWLDSTIAGFTRAQAAGLQSLQSNRWPESAPEPTG